MKANFVKKVSSTSPSPFGGGLGWGFRIAIRNLRKNGLYSAINIGGLAISLAACTFIFLWIQDEKSYDRFHKDAENIYTAVAHFKSDGGTEAYPVTSGLFGPVAKHDFPEVESFCRVRPWGVGYLQIEGVKSGGKNIIYTDSTFFSFFNFPIIKGEQQGLLQNPDDVIITERLAHELFSDNDPVGKIINLEGWKDVQVVAVMKDFPSQTSIPHGDIICSFKLMKDPWLVKTLDSWEGCEFWTYLRLKPGIDAIQLAENITSKQPGGNESERSFSLTPLTNLHLYNLDGEPAGIKTVNIFQWIALIILCIACINYMNLVTARASKRHKEIGLKKVIGAKRLQLFSQLMVEAIILFVVAATIASLLNLLLLPAYNQLSGKDIHFGWLNFDIWSIYGIMIISVIVLAGVYPAQLLASFRPVSLIQGIGAKRGNATFRKVLVVLQFVSCVALIMGTVTLGEQMKYIREKDLGYNREHVFMVGMYNIAEHYEAVKSELLQHAAIKGVAFGSENMMSVGSGTATANWEGITRESYVSLTQLRVDTSFVNVMKIKLTEGQGFTSTSEKQVILNETAIKTMGIQDPVGKWVELNGRSKIVGVAKDFHFKDLHQRIAPMVMYYQPPGLWYGLYVRTSAGEAKQALAAVEKVWKQCNPDYELSYNFMDETFNSMYLEDTRTGHLFGIFSIIAILISCLGLFGLVTYTAETKTKEIGIRKVLGASVAGIVEMLSKEFLILVGIAMLIAFPAAYYLLDKMLQDYAYRIDIGWWMFALAGIITIVLTLLTVGWKAMKAAMANPVKAIKAE